MSGDLSGLLVDGVGEMAFDGAVRVFEAGPTGFCSSRCLSCAFVLSALFEARATTDCFLCLAASGDCGVSGLVTERGAFGLKSLGGTVIELWAKARADMVATIKKEIQVLFIMTSLAPPNAENLLQLEHIFVTPGRT